MGVGAVVGGLVTAGRGRIGLRPLTVNAAAFGLLILVAAVAPTLAVEMVALVGVGAATCRSSPWGTPRAGHGQGAEDDGRPDAEILGGELMQPICKCRGMTRSSTSPRFAA